MMIRTRHVVILIMNKFIPWVVRQTGIVNLVALRKNMLLTFLGKLVVC